MAHQVLAGSRRRRSNLARARRRTGRKFRRGMHVRRTRRARPQPIPELEQTLAGITPVHDHIETRAPEKHVAGLTRSCRQSEARLSASAAIGLEP